MVASFLEKQGAGIINADGVYHGLLNSHQELRAALRGRFGLEVVPEQGPVNRRSLGRIVYADPVAMADLMAITHPFIRQEIVRLMSCPGHQVRVLNAPLLFEMGLASWMDLTVVVTVDPEVQIQRLMARDNIDREYALSKISNQLSSREKAEMADLVIDNSGSPQETGRLVEALWPSIIEMAEKRRMEWQI